MKIMNISPVNFNAKGQNVVSNFMKYDSPISFNNKKPYVKPSINYNFFREDNPTIKVRMTTKQPRQEKNPQINSIYIA